MNIEIKEWIISDVEGSWYQNDSNSNCYTDRKLGRVLYIYEDHVKYWDDGIRVPSVFVEYPIPKTKEELFCIINPKMTEGKPMTGREYSSLIECKSLRAPSAPTLPNRL